MTTNKEALKKFALERNMDYFGVAPVSRFVNLPDGYRPTDYLPRAKSVIVIGKKVPHSAFMAHQKAFSDNMQHAIGSYILFGYLKINSAIDQVLYQYTFHIEKKYQAVSFPIPTSEPRNEELGMSLLSNRYAAVCAGLAQFGWSGRAVNARHGARVRYGSIITELELEPDPIDRGERLCDPKTCDLCVRICPAGALSRDEEIAVKIEDFETGYAKRNKAKCKCGVYGLIKGTPGRLQADMAEPMETMEDWYNFNKKDNAWQRMEFTHGNYCDLCMMQCPLGQ